MPRPRNRAEVARRFCGGCWQDRYNHPGLCERPGIDAPVTSRYCWHNDPADAQYDRRNKRWLMPCWRR